MAALLEQHLTPEQVAAALQIKLRTIHEWCRTGQLRARKAGVLWRIPLSAIDELEVNADGGPPPVPRRRARGPSEADIARTDAELRKRGLL